MTDVQLALSVALGLVLVFGVTAAARMRLPSVPDGTPIGRIDMLNERLVAIEGRLKTTDHLDMVDERLVAIEGRLKATDHHVANIRTIIGALPSKDAVQRLEVELAVVKGDIKLGNAEGLATARAVERIENHLLAMAASATAAAARSTP